MKNVKININKCKQEKNETTVWEDDELDAMQIFSISSWVNHRTFRNSAVIFILCFTGLRLGELLSLKWADVDLQNGFINIISTQTEYTDYSTGKKIFTVSTPKNRASKRKIELLSIALEWFHMLKQRNETIGIHSDYVIATRKNNMVKVSSFIQQLRNFCRYAGVPYRASHTCRRTYITTCLDAPSIGIKRCRTSKNKYNTRRVS